MRRAIVEAPFAIRQLKRHCRTSTLQRLAVGPQRKPATGKRVAIVGGGQRPYRRRFPQLEDKCVTVLRDRPRRWRAAVRIPICLPKAILDKEIEVSARRHGDRYNVSGAKTLPGAALWGLRRGYLALALRRPCHEVQGWTLPAC
jgi:hypothetical protein